jgi:hypothetical protein
MSNKFMHPDRVLALFTQQRNATAVPAEFSVSAEPLSPGAEAARKQCINEQMMGLLNQTASGRSHPTNTKASIQGIGLYTHTSALGISDGETTRNRPLPEFLPLGGPKDIQTFEGLIQESLSEEMEQIWKHVEATINEEERLMTEASISEKQLQERYGALDVPDSNEAAAALTQKQMQNQQFMEAVRKLQAHKHSGDIAMGGTDNEGDASAAAGAHPAPKANMYNESRDPRRRG